MDIFIYLLNFIIITTATNFTPPSYFVRVDTPLMNLTRFEGASLRLSCEITGHPVPHYTWLKGPKWLGYGNNIASEDPVKENLINFVNDMKSDINNDIDGDDGVWGIKLENDDENELKSRDHQVQATHWGSRLKLDDLVLSDSGWYTCIASNHHDNKSSSAYLQVLPADKDKKRYQNNFKRRNKKPKVKPAKENIYELYDEEEEEEEEDDDVEYEIVYMENGDVDKYDPDSSEDLMQKVVPSQKCSYYTGNICYESLMSFQNTKNSNKFYTKVLHNIGTVSYVEKKIAYILSSMTKSSSICRQTSLHFMCRTLLQLCHPGEFDSETPETIKAPLCRADCQLLESAQCSDERDLILLSAASVKAFNGLLLKNSLCSSNFFSKDVSNVKCIAESHKNNEQDPLVRLAYVGVVCISLMLLICAAVVAVKRCRSNKEKNDKDPVKRKSPLLLNNDHHLSFSSSSQTYPPSVLAVSPINISFLYPLGNGHFGPVYAAQLTERASRQTVIAFTLNELIDQGSKARFDKELKVLSTFTSDHTNLLRVVAVCSSGPPRCILYEFVDGVDLKQHLISMATNQPIDVSLALNYSCQVSRGFEYLAERNYFHGDVAARNIVILKSQVLKLTNLGISKNLYEGDYCMCPCGQVLPLRWSPSERVLSGEISPFSEIWSLGMTIFEIFSGSPRPFNALTDAQLISEMEAGRQLVPQLPRHVPEEVKKVIDGCFMSNASSRITATQLRKNLESLGFLLSSNSFNNDESQLSYKNPFTFNTSGLFSEPKNSPNLMPFLMPPNFNSNQQPLMPQKIQSPQLQQPPHNLLTAQQQYLPQKLLLPQQHPFFNIHQVSPTTSSSNNTASSNLVPSPPKQDNDEKIHC